MAEQVSIIIQTRDKIQRLDGILNSIFQYAADLKLEIIVLDQGGAKASSSTSKVIDKYALQAFIRHIPAADSSVTAYDSSIQEKARYSRKLIIINDQEHKPESIKQALSRLADPKAQVHQLTLGRDEESGAGQGKSQGKPAPQQPLQGWARTSEDQPRGLNILFVLPESLESNNGYQAQLLTRMLSTQGANCAIAVPELSDEQRVASNDPSASPQITINYSQLTEKDAPASFDLIHAWTPREQVRKACEDILAKHNCPLIIHLEDNEEYLTQSIVGKPWEELSKMPESTLDKIILRNIYHPVNGPKFLDQAQGLTMVIDTLNRFNPNGLPCQVIPPLVDERLFYPRPINKELRKKHNIPDDTTVLVYSGNVHKANVQEVARLYKAVAMLNNQGQPTVLLRTGTNRTPLVPEAQAGKKYEIHLGWVKREELPDILAAADMFVQPGEPGPYNDQRIPCKLPEYFAMGRPVILPKTNLGLNVEHGKDGFVLNRGDAKGIVEAVKQVWGDTELRNNLGHNAVDFYLDTFGQRIHVQAYDFCHSISDMHSR